MRRFIRFLLLICGVLVISGCAGPLIEPTTIAQLGYKTKTHDDLINLPAPKGKIVIAVYKFGDQTGQYKANPTSTSFSTSVTQGATSMLLETLQATKWFIPVEREGLNNLLTERKILMAKLKTDGKEGSLPKLYHAPILLEGGIISYETNVSTGGIGARYLGIGGSAQYQKDQIALYLRAVDVNRGDVLLSVSTTKSILSQEIQFGVFKFVDTEKLLEGELGYTRNEPPQLCVLEALEKAVLSLIIEGILDRKWELKNPDEIRNPVIRKYLEEKGSESPDKVFDNYLASAFDIPAMEQDDSSGLRGQSAKAATADEVSTVVENALEIELPRLHLRPMLYKNKHSVQVIRNS
jgi:curli production assembly/transport component CsgG